MKKLISNCLQVVSIISLSFTNAGAKVWTAKLYSRQGKLPYRAGSISESP